MKRYLFLAVAFSSAAIGVACSSSSSGGGTTGTQTDASQPQKDATTATNDGSTPTDDGSTTMDDGGSTGTDSGPSGPTLTINNYLAWCSIKVNGGTPSSADPQTYTFAPDASVTLHGDTANAGMFFWGYWGNTDMVGQPADGGMDLSQDLSFTMPNGNVTLHACCPDNGMPLSQCTF